MDSILIHSGDQRSILRHLTLKERNHNSNVLSWLLEAQCPPLPNCTKCLTFVTLLYWSIQIISNVKTLETWKGFFLTYQWTKMKFKISIKLQFWRLSKSYPLTKGETRSQYFHYQWQRTVRYKLRFPPQGQKAWVLE